jgi:hypothetical protein
MNKMNRNLMEWKERRLSENFRTRITWILPKGESFHFPPSHPIPSLLFHPLFLSLWLEKHFLPLSPLASLAPLERLEARESTR